MDKSKQTTLSIGLFAISAYGIGIVSAEYRLNSHQLEIVTAGKQVGRSNSVGGLGARGIAVGGEASVNLDVSRNYSRASSQAKAFDFNGAKSKAEAVGVPERNISASPSGILPRKIVSDSRFILQPKPFR